MSNDYEVIGVKFYSPAQVLINTPVGHRYIDVYINRDDGEVIAKEDLPLGVGAGTFEKRVIDFIAGAPAVRGCL